MVFPVLMLARCFRDELTRLIRLSMKVPIEEIVISS